MSSFIEVQEVVARSSRTEAGKFLKDVQKRSVNKDQIASFYAGIYPASLVLCMSDGTKIVVRDTPALSNVMGPPILKTQMVENPKPKEAMPNPQRKSSKKKPKKNWGI